MNPVKIIKCAESQLNILLLVGKPGSGFGVRIRDAVIIRFGLSLTRRKLVLEVRAYQTFM